MRIEHPKPTIHVAYTRLGDTTAEYDGVNEHGFFAYKVERGGKYCNYTFAPELYEQYRAIIGHMGILMAVEPKPTSELTREELRKVDAAIMPMDQMRAAAEDGRIANPRLKEYFEKLEAAVKKVTSEEVDGADKE